MLHAFSFPVSVSFSVSLLLLVGHHFNGVGVDDLFFMGVGVCYGLMFM